MDKKEPYEYLEAFISLDSMNRLIRLSERIGKSEDEVIETALRWYENILDALDDGWDGLYC